MMVEMRGNNGDGGSTIGGELGRFHLHEERKERKL